MDAPRTAAPAPERFTRTSVLVVVLCWATVVADGYDVVAYGVALPSLFEEAGWGMTPTLAGAVGSSALVGMLIGSLLAGPVARWIGKKRLLVACVATFSTFTAACALADGPLVFAALRFGAGLALGGVLPAASALTAQFTPPRYRNVAFAVMFAGLPTGAVLAAVLGVVLIPEWGWRSIFVLGLLPALVVVPLALRWLPAAPATGPASRVDASRTADAAGPVELFARGYRVITLCLFGATFLCLFMIYAINIWLPQMLRTEGYSLGGSLTSVLVFNVGAAVGTVVVGLVADRLGTRTTLVCAFVLTSASVAVISIAPGSLGLYLVIAAAGIGATSAQTLIISLLSQTYPPHLATVGMGWSLGSGRVGSILAPIALGALVASGFGLGASTAVLASAGAVAVMLVLLVPRTVATGKIAGRPDAVAVARG